VGRAVLTQQTPDYSGGGAPPVAAILASDSRGALRVWGGFAVLMLLVSAPLFSTVLPPLFDYPNHLARMHLLSEGGDAFYAVNWRLLPNLAQDLIVPPLARLVPLAIASKLFLVMVFGVIASATIWLNRVAGGRWRLWPLLAFLLLYNRIFLWGFVNYLFGIGIALGGTALWLALECKGWRLRVSTSSLAALACYFSHIAAFGFYVLVIIGVEAAPTLSELRRGEWRALGRRTIIAGPQFLVPAALFFGSWQETARGPTNYAGFLRKADLLFSVFDNYHRAFDIACFALFLGLVGWLSVTGRLRMIPRLGWAAGVVFTAYLLMPSQMYGGSAADHRLPAALFLLLVASCAPRFPSRCIAVTVGIVAVSALVLRLAAIERVWSLADRVYSANLVGIDSLPRGAKLAVAYPATTINFTPIPEAHFAALAIVRREAFVPILFASPAQQPVVLRAPYVALAEAALPERLWAAYVGDDSSELAGPAPVVQQYDYIAFTDNRPVQVPPNRCLAPIFERPSFQIFAIVHAPSCSKAKG
jgi:hypothetical protein